MVFYKDKGIQEERVKQKYVGGAEGLYDPGSEVPKPGLWLSVILPRPLSQELGDTDLSIAIRCWIRPGWYVSL